MISGTTTIMLRSGVARTCGIQPQAILLWTSTATTTSTSTTGSSAYSYSTFLTSPFSARSKLQSATTKTNQSNTSPILCFRPQRPSIIPSTRRSTSNSSDHEQDAAAAKRAAERVAASIKPGEDMPPLDWNTFFQLRKSRRMWQVAGSATMSLVSGAGGIGILTSGAVDSVTAQIPLDPFVSMGLMFFGFIALGWLVGPTVGNSVFYLLNRKYKAPMTLVSWLDRVPLTELLLRQSLLTQIFLCHRKKASSLRESRRIVSTLPVPQAEIQVRPASLLH